MAVRIQFRRGTAAEWTSANPTLAAGELGYETDTTKFKLGDGSTSWTSLGYGGVSQGDIDNAVANVIDLAPGTLDTLNELAASIGDDADFANTVTNNIATAEANAIAHANSVASSAQTAAAGYTDTAIADLINSAPDALNTLDELANALGDDANFSATVTNSLANKINYVTDTSANFTSANAVTTANVLYVESDQPSYLRVGDGSTNYNSLDWVGKDYTDTQLTSHNNTTTNVHGIADTGELVTNTALNALNDDVNTVSSSLSTHESGTNVHGIANTADLLVTSDKTELQGDLSTHNSSTTNVHGIANTALLATDSDVANAVADHSALSANVHGIANVADLVVTSDLSVYATTSNVNAELGDKADIASPTFTGTVVLPSTTSIGDVDSTEIGYLNGVTSAIQTQLNAKLGTSTASSTYAPLADATLTGTVSLPATTSIGDVSATEIGYLNNVSSAIQTQLDAKLASATASSTYAPIDSPTFTTEATLPASTTIGDVSATEISYLNNVTSAIQTQLDAKAPIADATFTGSTEAVDLTITGNLYVQGSTTTISTSDLKVRDNMLYMNQAGLFDISGASGDGTNVIYTTSTNHDFAAGDFVTVANTTPSSFDIGAGDGVEILAITDNTFTVTSSVTDTYTSGGDARGKIHANPDLGWAAGRYADNTYAHAGIFRDASDGVFKFFDGYVPEPDESAFINTSDNTFALAPLEVAEVTAANLIATTGVVFPDSTVQTAAGVPSITGFTEKTASYTLDTLDHQDNVVEMNSASALTFTIPTNTALAWPVGASMDIIQTGAGQVTISPDTGVTLNYTPGNKLRTQWSSCTIMKRATNSWIVYGDLTA